MKFLVKACFAAFFVVHGYDLLAHPETHKALFRAHYTRFNAQVKSLSGHALPGFMSVATVGRHAQEALLGYGWALMAAAVASVLYNGFGILAALLYFLEAVVVQDALDLFKQSARPRQLVPIAETTALLLGALVVDAWCSRRPPNRKPR